MDDATRPLNDKAVAIGTRMLKEPGFVPEKTYLMDSRIITK